MRGRNRRRSAIYFAAKPRSLVPLLVLGSTMFVWVLSYLCPCLNCTMCALVMIISDNHVTINNHDKVNLAYQ